MPQPNYRFGYGRYGVGKWGNPPISYLPVGYYQRLISPEYQTSPKHLAWLLAVLQVLDDASACLASMTTAFDLDYAVGVQLDTLGLIIGQSRTVGFQPSNGVSPVLTDDVYRTLLKAKIIQNQWHGDVTKLYTDWQALFPGGRITIIDNQNMTITVILSGNFPSIVKDLILNGLVVPVPETVGVEFVFGTLPAFGFDQNNDFIAGFDTGHWS